MEDFERLQERLGRAWALNRPGVDVEHVMVLLPSYSVGESLLSHYADRIPALEHRWLLAFFLLGRIEACEMVMVSTWAPEPTVLDYYESLLPADRRASARRRFHHVALPDGSPRSVAARLLERPGVLGGIRDLIGARPAFIEPWNVTEDEVDVALRLGVPINGTDPRLWPLGFKSAGRRLFREARVPTPKGREDVRSVEDVLSAIDELRAERPGAPGVVVKLDNSGAGEGNVVLRFDPVPGAPPSGVDLRTRVQSLPPWFLDELGDGGVVEELVAGERFTSPSAQLEITPFGEVVVLATHEQVLGGETGQVYTGCRFPADSEYAPELASHARAVGEQLARRGALGRFSVDFVVAASRSRPREVYGLELNLRKGGTTHPYSALRNLVPGRYDSERGAWITGDGTPRWYRATDNLLDRAWRNLPPGRVIEWIADAGLQFDCEKGTGVVLHMLSCLQVDGRFGLTAIGASREHAEELYDAVESAVRAGASPRRTSA